MSDNYKEFLERLVKYRLRLNMTQEMISEKLGITQSQLSKQELGKTIVPYKSLENFVRIGWNIDYLLTGKEVQSRVSELTKILEEVDEIHYKSMLEFITWALGIGIEKSVQFMSLEEKCEIGILKMKSSSEKSSIMYEVRKIAGETQITMAEKLGVNIKKYRALEKAQIYPDAELLLGIYKITGCRPSLFLVKEHIENVIIDDLWRKIDRERRSEIMEIALHVGQLVRM